MLVVAISDLSLFLLGWSFVLRRSSLWVPVVSFAGIGKGFVPSLGEDVVGMGWKVRQPFSFAVPHAGKVGQVDPRDASLPKVFVGREFDNVFVLRFNVQGQPFQLVVKDLLVPQQNVYPNQGRYLLKAFLGLRFKLCVGVIVVCQVLKGNLLCVLEVLVYRQLVDPLCPNSGLGVVPEEIKELFLNQQGKMGIHLVRNQTFVQEPHMHRQQGVPRTKVATNPARSVPASIDKNKTR